MTKKKTGIVLGVVGSRQRNSDNDFGQVLAHIMRLKPELIVSGGRHKGADKFAGEIAKILGIPILICYPKERNAECFHKRNIEIAEKCNVLLALVSNKRAGGAEGAIEHAKKLGKEVIIK